MKMETHNLNVFKLNVNVADILLTPMAGASLVNEILKGILYQKCQIPYPYSRLKTVVNTKRQKTENETSHKSMKAASHFSLVSSVFDKLESAMQGIINEFSQHKSNIKEVLIVLGTTPHTASEVFSISLTSLVDGHIEKNHISQLNKYQQKILRSIFLSQEWLDKIVASVSCTNVYLYLLKTRVESDGSPKNDFAFVPTAPLTFSNKAKHMKISFVAETKQGTNCCENLAVFEDVSGSSILLNKIKYNVETEKDVTWYRFKDIIKGFKDCFENKKSVSDSW